VNPLIPNRIFKFDNKSCVRDLIQSNFQWLCFLFHYRIIYFFNIKTFFFYLWIIFDFRLLEWNFKYLHCRFCNLSGIKIVSSYLLKIILWLGIYWNFQYNTNQGLAELCDNNERHSLTSYTKHIATPTPEDRWMQPKTYTNYTCRPMLSQTYQLCV
jgi:hypothetical protein